MKKIRTSKHLITLLLLVLCVWVLAACGNDSGGANTGKFDLCFIVDNTVYETVESFSGEKDMPEVPTKDGYSFDGWYYDNGTWKKPFSATDELTENKNVYCKWKAVEYQAKFIADGDVVKTVDFTVNDTELRNIPSVPSKNGYTGEWESYTLGKENIEINAVYTPITYTVTYQNTKDAANTNVSEYTIENETISLGSLSGVDGYTFDGWYDARGNKVQEISKGTTGNLALTAKWTPITYTATFYADGVEVGTATFTVEDTVIKNAPAVPEKTGYQSGIWEEYTIIPQNISINAVYTSIGYFITYNSEISATNSNPTTYSIDTDTISLVAPVPTSSAYVFLGWFDSEGIQVETINKGTTGNISLTAKWSYKITTVADLLLCPMNMDVYLDANIDLGGITISPLGTNDIPFSGTFNGNGHKIFNFKISGNAENLGLFRINKGTIKDLRVENATVSSSGEYTGILCGSNEGLIENCYSSGSLSSSGRYAGGLIGNNSGEMKYCNSSVVITLTSNVSYVGGLVARNSGNITGSSATGEISGVASMAGGLVAYNEGLVSLSFATGNINITTYGYSGTSYMINGGLVGTNAEGATVINCFAVGDLVTTVYCWTGYSGGLVGRNDGSVLNSYATGDVSSTYHRTHTSSSIVSGGLIGYLYDGACVKNSFAIGSTSATIKESTSNNTDCYTNALVGRAYSNYQINNCYTIRSSSYASLVTIDNLKDSNWIKENLWTTDNECWEFTGDLPIVNTQVDPLENPDSYYHTAIFYVDGQKIGVRVFANDDETISSIPEIPARTGYTGKWSEYSLEDKNIVIYAVYTPVVYTIQYDNGKEAENNNPVTYTVEDETITLNDIEVTGYIFNGWYNENGSKVTELSTQNCKNYILTARWTPFEYKITYHNIENASNSNQATYTIEDCVELVGAEKAGYTFTGWLDADNNPITVIQQGTYGDIDVYGGWTANTYTITFVTNGGTDVAAITQECDTSITEPQKPIREGYSFVGWYVSASATDAYVFDKMPTSDLTLYAKWQVYSLNAIEYDASVQGVSYYNELTAEWFKATCIDTDGENVPVSITYSGNFEIGETVTITLVATKNNKTVQTRIENVKVYGLPTLNYDDTVDYFNIETGLTVDCFAASGTDTFNSATSINIYVDGEYEAGDYVTVIIEAIDVTGNKTTAYVENVKAYGLPVITYNTQKSEISVNDTLSSALFDATAVDSFGEVVEVAVSQANGTMTAGNVVTIRLAATDSKGNTTNIEFECQVYGNPNISDATKLEFKTDDNITVETLGIEAVDTFGEKLAVALSTSDVQTAGTVMTIVATVVDKAGNSVFKNYSVKIYGTPTIEYNRTDIKVTEDPAELTMGYPTVSYMYNDGTNNVFTTQTLTSDTSLIYPSAPQRNGYVFAGWFDTKECEGQQFDFSQPLNANKTLYAKWIEHSGVGAITFNQNISVDVVSKSSSTVNLYAFVPLVDGTVTIYSISSMDTYGYLYDSSKSQLTSNDDSGDGSNFKMTYEVSAGTLYYIRPCGYSSSGTITLRVDVNVPSAGGTGSFVCLYSGSADILNAVAYDSFGNKLIIEVAQKSGERVGGSTVVYTLKTTDHLGNTYEIDTVPIKVYDAADIELTYSAMASNLIKITSEGEEFLASATDSFGELCDIKIEAAEGYTLSGGTIIPMYLVATDTAGNKIYSDIIENIKVFDSPRITFNQSNYVITESTDISFLFTALDSFGEELYPTISVSGEQIAGNMVVVTVTATDNAKNTTVEQYSLGVQSSEKSFVELYVDGELWQLLFVDDVNNYTLPLLELDEGFEAFWADEEGNQYTDIAGNGVLKLPESIQLQFIDYKTGYTPIYTIKQLKNITMDGFYCLLLDLDLNGTEWVPLGTSSKPFAGIFDGNGYTISNYTITSSANYAGLFGYNTGIIRNLGVKDFTINVTRGGDGYAGGLVGYNNLGSITNCYATGDISIILDSDYVYTGGVSYVYNYAGGLVGYNKNGTITNCYASGTVDSTITAISSYCYSYSGGLVGYNNAGITTNCYAIGNVNSSATSSIGSSYSSSNSYAGGLIGYDSNGKITNCFATGNISSTAISGSTNGYAGGLVGYTSSGSIVNCYRFSGQSFTVIRGGNSPSTNRYASNSHGTATTLENLQSKDWASDNLWETIELEIWDFSTGYPTLNYDVINETVKISNKTQLLELQGQVLTRNYVLTEDVNLDGIERTPISIFAGDFDGNGHVVSNFKITGSLNYAGLFGYNVGSIKNLGVEDFTINVSRNGDVFAGGLVGYNKSGKIIHCYTSGEVKSANSSSSSDTKYYSYAGGLVGYIASGDISHSHSSASVIAKATSNYSYTDNSCYSYSYSGGLVGYVGGGRISNCYTTGDVSSNSSSRYSPSYSYTGGLVAYNNGGTIINCYATGTVSSSATSGTISGSSKCYGYGYAGGLIGYNESGSIMNSYAIGNVSAYVSASYNRSYSGGLVGYKSYGSVTNCFATGNVKSSSKSASYAGGFVGNDNTSSITNCYRLNNQSFTVTQNGTSSSTATNTTATESEVAMLQSTTFQNDTLGWTTDDWILEEGSYPTLKNVGITN